MVQIFKTISDHTEYLDRTMEFPLWGLMAELSSHMACAIGPCGMDMVRHGARVDAHLLVAGTCELSTPGMAYSMNPAWIGVTLHPRRQGGHRLLPERSAPKIQHRRSQNSAVMPKDYPGPDEVQEFLGPKKPGKSRLTRHLLANPSSKM
jgi:hypothetical protein